MDSMNSYVVHVVDPVVDQADAYGPCDKLTATMMAAHIRHDLDEWNMHDVSIAVLALRR